MYLMVCPFGPRYVDPSTRAMDPTPRPATTAAAALRPAVAIPNDIPPDDAPAVAKQRRTANRRYREGDPLPIARVAERTGLSPSLLRIWEERYGWPMPSRQSNQYRHYAPALVDALDAVRFLIASGLTIGEIMADSTLSPRENPTLTIASLRAPRPRRGRLDFSTLPAPQTPAGQRIRERLEAALHTDDRGTIALVEAEGQRLRPEERERAVSSLLRLAAQEIGGQSSAGAQAHSG